MDFPSSEFKKKPKSTIVKHGYINEYSKLSPEERRQIIYKNKYKEENPKWDDTLVYLSRKFKELAPENAVVLDAGCGHGNYVIDENRKSIFRAAGVDLSDDYVSKNICLDEIKISDLQNIPYEDNTFDVCISLWVLEHIKLPSQVLEEISRVLKPDGLFMFAVPHKNFIPLVAVRMFKFIKFNHLINRVLFGRKPQDVFPAYYRINTLRNIKKVISKDFKTIELRYNYDPSYTSFNNLSYWGSNMVHKSFSKMGFSITYPHIIGILQKRVSK